MDRREKRKAREKCPRSLFVPVFAEELKNRAIHRQKRRKQDETEENPAITDIGSDIMRNWTAKQNYGCARCAGRPCDGGRWKSTHTR